MLIAEKDANGATIATYLYDHAGYPVSMTRGGKTYYYHYNVHGDTIALTDDSGNIAARYAYDIWGNIISKEGDIDNPFTYGGQWGYIHDDESGLYFLKTRYYDPSIGRFISRDRFAGFENDPDLTSIAPSVSAIKNDPNKMNHILQDKHAWGLVVKMQMIGIKLHE